MGDARAPRETATVPPEVRDRFVGVAASFEETALRELREETGIQTTIEQLTGLYYERADDLHHLVFRCRFPGIPAPRPSSPEISGCRFFSADALPRPISDFTIRRINDAIDAATPDAVVNIPPRTWLE